MSESCGGCQYCDFPYKAQIPIKVDGKYKIKEFNSTEDVWEVIDLLINETVELNKIKGNDFDLSINIISQIPFFSCLNHIRDIEHLKFINKYVFSTETGTPAYNGCYGEQPAMWVDYFFIIKNALAKKEKMMHDKSRRENKNG